MDPPVAGELHMEPPDVLAAAAVSPADYCFCNKHILCALSCCQLHSSMNTVSHIWVELS